MQDLLERLGKATEPDRELDVYIAMAVFPGAKRYGAPPWICIPSESGVDERVLTTPLPYTSSIDAALTLVPRSDDSRWYIADSDVESDDRAVAAVYTIKQMLHEGRIQRSVGATPAIALCIAAIKARSNDDGTNTQSAPETTLRTL